MSSIDLPQIASVIVEMRGIIEEEADPEETQMIPEANLTLSDPISKNGFNPRIQNTIPIILPEKPIRVLHSREPHKQGLE